MIELEVPKDIRKYDAKLFGPFTTRQLVCFAAICVISLLLYKLLEGFFENTAKDGMFFIIILINLPLILVGWVKPFGMAFEKFAQTVFVSYFLSPAERKYKTPDPYREEEVKKLNKATQKKLAKQQKTSKTLIAYD